MSKLLILCSTQHVKTTSLATYKCERCGTQYKPKHSVDYISPIPPTFLQSAGVSQYRVSPHSSLVTSRSSDIRQWRGGNYLTARRSSPLFHSSSSHFLHFFALTMSERDRLLTSSYQRAGPGDEEKQIHSRPPSDELTSAHGVRHKGQVSTLPALKQQRSEPAVTSLSSLCRCVAFCVC